MWSGHRRFEQPTLLHFMRSCVILQYVHLGGIPPASHEDKCRPRQTKRSDAMLRQLGQKVSLIPNLVAAILEIIVGPRNYAWPFHQD